MYSPGALLRSTTYFFFEIDLFRKSVNQNFEFELIFVDKSTLNTDKSLA